MGMEVVKEDQISNLCARLAASESFGQTDAVPLATKSIQTAQNKGVALDKVIIETHEVLKRYGEIKANNDAKKKHPWLHFLTS